MANIGEVYAENEQSIKARKKSVLVNICIYIYMQINGIVAPDWLIPYLAIT